MAVSRELHLLLGTEQQRLLEEWLLEFERGWTPDALAAWHHRLQSQPPKLGQAAMVELVKVDLERRWESGQHETLSSYLDRYPSLGTRDTVPVELICTEIEVHQQFGRPMTSELLAAQYPGRESDWRPLLDASTSQAKAVETSRLESETIKPEQPFDGTSMSSSVEVPRPFGRYQLLKVLGRGGMGSVYLAEDTSLHRKCAIKMPHFAGKRDREILDRFYREAQAAARVEHPNICAVYDVGEIDGQHFISMAYIEGRPLTHYISPSKPGRQRPTVLMMHKLATALANAHQQQIVHRDLKPANIMIKNNSQPVVMDFGLACSLETSDKSRVTMEGTLLGSPAYMSPEQVLGKIKEVGPTSDVYSLGVILFEMLAGRTPFQGSIQAILGQIIGQEPPRLKELRPDIDLDLEAICLKMMAKAPAARYQSMDEVADALTEWLKKVHVGADGSETMVGAAPSNPTPAVQPAVTARPITPSQPASPTPPSLSEMPTIAPTPRKSLPSPVINIDPTSRTIVTAPTSYSRPQSNRSSSKAVGWWVGGILGGILLLAGIVIFIQTDNGTLRIEINDDALELAINGNEVQFTDLASAMDLDDGEHELKIMVAGVAVPIGETFTLATGEHQGEYRMAVSLGDTELSGEKFTFSRNGATALKVELVRTGPLTVEENSFATDAGDSPPSIPGGLSASDLPLLTTGANAARQYQVDYAESVGLPVEIENALGMRFRLIPPGQYLMGSPTDEVGRDEMPRDPFGPNASPLPDGDQELQHLVTVTQPFYMATTELTQSQFEAVMGETPNGIRAGKSPEHPVGIIGHLAGTFVERVNQFPEEVAAGHTYRLPSEAEWEYACRAGSPAAFHFGDDRSQLDEYDWYAGNTREPQPGGLKLPNGFGLYDMHGNVREWCIDHYVAYPDHPVSDPLNDSEIPLSGAPSQRVIRGGSYTTSASLSRCAWRYRCDTRTLYHEGFGIRLILDVELPDPSTVGPTETNVDEPALLVAPFNVDQAHAAQQQWADHLGTEVVVENSIGMQLALIPPGEFEMGSARSEWDESLRLWPEIDLSYFVDEPQHRVRLTQPCVVGIHEVTVGQFRQFVDSDNYLTEPERDGEGGFGWNSSTERGEGRDPKYTWQHTGWTPYGEDHPVVNVTWIDSIAFCNWLSRNEGFDEYYRVLNNGEGVSISGGDGYRLLTEAEWEYACRAGTTTMWQHGNSSDGLEDLGNVADLSYVAVWGSRPGFAYLDTYDGYAFTAPVGQYRANGFGLHDMHGNVWEWCWDAYDTLAYTRRLELTEDPIENGPTLERTQRGGSYLAPVRAFRMADRGRMAPGNRASDVGFRVARYIQPALPSSPTALVAPFDIEEAHATQQQWADHLGTEVVVENSIGMQLALIPPGEFLMGSTSDEWEQIQQLWPEIDVADFDDESQHGVRLTLTFSVGVYEVTVGQFRQFVEEADYVTEAERTGGGRGWNSMTQRFEGPAPEYTWQNPGWTPYDEDHPVVNITWNDAIAFCNWLSLREGLDEYYDTAGDSTSTTIRGGDGYRLLTEAEWEYACRAGSTTIWQHGDDPSELVEFGNIVDLDARDAWTNSQSATFIDAHDGFAFTAPVGHFRPNAFGLYDMHGNVYEWCWDGYDRNAYNDNADIRIDPVVSNPTDQRTLRGGSWFYHPGYTRSAVRWGQSPEIRYYNGGFRIARTVTPPPARLD